MSSSLSPEASVERLLTVYPREAVLTREQLAAALQVGAGMIDEMALPVVRASTRTYRYVYGVVLDELARRSKP